jgi:hypothetical protein
VEERFPLQRGWRGSFSPWRKRGKGIGRLLERFFLSSDPLYHCFFNIGDGKGDRIKLLLRATPPDGVNFIPYMMLLGVE